MKTKEGKRNKPLNIQYSAAYLLLRVGCYCWWKAYLRSRKTPTSM